MAGSSPTSFNARSTFSIAIGEIATGPIGLLRPVGGIHSGIAVQRIDAQAGIVGQCHHACRRRGGVGLGVGVLLERRANLRRFRQVVVGSAGQPPAR